MNVFYYQHSGHYDWMHPEKLQWQVVLNVGDIKIYEVFDEEQDIDDYLPTDVAELILKRSDHYLYNGRKAEVTKNVAWIREHANEINDSYLVIQILNLKRQIDRLASQLSEDYNGS